MVLCYLIYYRKFLKFLSILHQTAINLTFDSPAFKTFCKSCCSKLINGFIVLPNHLLTSPNDICFANLFSVKFIIFDNLRLSHLNLLLDFPWFCFQILMLYLQFDQLNPFIISINSFNLLNFFKVSIFKLLFNIWSYFTNYLIC